MLLSDARTASASEILMEALVDNDRAVSFGDKTVGKNVAQAVMSLSDGSGLCFTVREFFTPKGRSMRSGHSPTYNLSKNAKSYAFSNLFNPVNSLKVPTSSVNIGSINYIEKSREWIIN